jgi:hypothetical protein
MTTSAVYLETSVIGYATSRLSRDLVVAAHQQITREWFASRARRYDLFVSQLVVREASGGDEEAARASSQRRSWRAGPCPGPAAAEDALHIAVAAVHGVDYLLTWKCRR